MFLSGRRRCLESETEHDRWRLIELGERQRDREIEEGFSGERERGEGERGGAREGDRARWRERETGRENNIERANETKTMGNELTQKDNSMRGEVRGIRE